MQDKPLNSNDIRPISIYFDPFLGFPWEETAAPAWQLTPSCALQGTTGCGKSSMLCLGLEIFRDSFIIPAGFTIPHFVEMEFNFMLPASTCLFPHTKKDRVTPQETAGQLYCPCSNLMQFFSIGNVPGCAAPTVEAGTIAYHRAAQGSHCHQRSLDKSWEGCAGCAFAKCV